MDKFYCDKCGLCCQNLNKNSLYDDLNDGTGTCIHFDKKTNLCTIYDNRPIKCNVEKAYLEYKFDMTYEEFLEKNYEACRKLKGE